MSKAKFNQSETVTVKRSQIKFAPYNPKKHDKAAVDQIKKNFKKVGFLGGIVWNTATGNLVDGHKRIMSMDALNGYDGTPEKDYDVKVEMCELDAKTEREQNVFQTASRTELDFTTLSTFINEIDFLNAGLTEADVQMIEFENPNFDFVPAPETKAGVDAMNKANEAIKKAEAEASNPEQAEAERQAKIEAVKAVKAEQTKPSHYSKHFTVTFETPEDKIYFLEQLGVDAETEFINGKILEKALFGE